MQWQQWHSDAKKVASREVATQNRSAIVTAACCTLWDDGRLVAGIAGDRGRR